MIKPTDSTTNITGGDVRYEKDYCLVEKPAPGSAWNFTVQTYLPEEALNNLALTNKRHLKFRVMLNDTFINHLSPKNRKYENTTPSPGTPSTA